MDRLRPRARKELSGFTKNEVEKMESLLSSGDQLLKREFCQKLASSFNRSTGRAGKSAVKWIQIQNWYRDRLEVWPSKVTSPYDASKILSVYPGVRTPTKEHDAVVERSDLSTLEFEARSSKDGAWFDVDIFLAHRFRSSGEPEVCVRFVGFGAEEDEWVNVRTAVRVRSVPFENSECDKIKVGDLVLCLQERKDLAMYYDAHVTDIHRRVHDIRGCRCLFFIRYNHDNTEERVRLGRLCRRPMYYG